MPPASSASLQARRRGLPSTAIRLYCRTSSASSRSFSSCSLPVVCSSCLLLSCRGRRLQGQDKTCWCGPGEVSTGGAVVKRNQRNCRCGGLLQGEAHRLTLPAWPPLLFAAAGAKEEDEQIRSGRKKK